MKRIALLFVASLLMSAASYAGEKSASATTWNWSINAGRLSQCLELSSTQYDNVALACEYFSDRLVKAARSKDEASRSKLVRDAVLGNMKLMKSALDRKQYKKFVVLLNVTLRNKGLDVYLD